MDVVQVMEVVEGVKSWVGGPCQHYANSGDGDDDEDEDEDGTQRR